MSSIDKQTDPPLELEASDLDVVGEGTSESEPGRLRSRLLSSSFTDHFRTREPCVSMSRYCPVQPTES